MKKIILVILSIFIFQVCKKNTNEKVFLEEAKETALQAKSELGKNLSNAIKSKGTAEAIVFCNQKAIPLTIEMSEKAGMLLKRVSDKPRNIVNTANEEEKNIIDEFKTQLSKGEKLKPVLKETNVEKIAYLPIETNAMCLQCHGSLEKDISKEVQQKLKELYPNDKAVGYSENQMRGMWVVSKKLESN
ncbi:MAG TPA: DUF3365 domain-containing protein [Leptospiraceae bacterium]|nr:DUF3365 domain-containing protein [Leptospiraceae bacterium]HMW06046.1 DUF3365 domain-containing protein [Leptospiraceae bacterium]HMX33916.1 DUF3365 domain-containing protein [Leptospiraceae bacterium]HMY31412.1 DUF3365 domain-containing protein [Leptospiraceae bacterium]HMZ67255.1 DUF3365 domain-containing protein [Leptospiraceae bacterium]